MAEKLEHDEWLMGQVAAGKAELLEPLVRRYFSERAGDGSRTHDVQLGKLTFYH